MRGGEARVGESVAAFAGLCDLAVMRHGLRWPTAPGSPPGASVQLVIIAYQSGLSPNDA